MSGGDMIFSHHRGWEGVGIESCNALIPANDDFGHVARTEMPSTALVRGPRCPEKSFRGSAPPSVAQSPSPNVA